MRSDTEPAPNPRGPRLRTILLAEDDPGLRAVLRLTLERSDHRVVATGDGSECLRLARTLLPDLLVIDWMLPGLDGIDVVERLKEAPRTAAIPAIMVTVRDDVRSTERAAAAGVFAYLTKPFRPLELLEMTDRALESGYGTEARNP